MTRVHWLTSGILQVGCDDGIVEYVGLAGLEEDVPDEIAACLSLAGMAVVVPRPSPKKRRKGA